MNIEKILSISGKPGLFKLLAQSKNGFIVEELTSNKKTSISAQHQISLLENISIYTHEEDISLSDVFNEMAKNYDGKQAISHKSLESNLRKEVQEFLPNYDEDRVHASDLKKLFQWYNILADKGLAVYEEKTENEASGEE